MGLEKETSMGKSKEGRLHKRRLLAVVSSQQSLNKDIRGSQGEAVKLR